MYLCTNMLVVTMHLSTSTQDSDFFEARNQMSKIFMSLVSSYSLSNKKSYCSINLKKKETKEEKQSLELRTVQLVARCLN